MSSMWKITIPVARAEDRTDGLYIVGEASGPERDSHGTQMSPEAIHDFARQIADRVAAGDPIPYIDSHQKTGLLRELGHVMEGMVTPDYHLRIAVRLDDNNPAASFLYEGLKRGKQYGMSVAGDGVEHMTVRDDSGNRVVRFMKVVLREISNTTRPSWVPSLGTVLARSIDGELGDDSMSDNLENESAPEVETTGSVESAPVADVANSDDAPTAPEAEETSAEETTPAETERGDETVPSVDDISVERSRISKKDAEAMLAAYSAMGTQLKALGIIEDATDAPETTTVENSETGDDTFNGLPVSRDLSDAIKTFVSTEVERATVSLTTVIENQAATIKALEELPAGKVPPALVRDKFESDKPDLSAMSPEDRLRWGLTQVYGD